MIIHPQLIPSVPGHGISAMVLHTLLHMIPGIHSQQPGPIQYVLLLLLQPIVQVPVVEEPIVELTPKFAEAEEKKIQEVDKAEQNQEVIKTLRVKLENGTISDGEAQRLFALLSDK